MSPKLWCNRANSDFIHKNNSNIAYVYKYKYEKKQKSDKPKLTVIIQVLAGFLNSFFVENEALNEKMSFFFSRRIFTRKIITRSVVPQFWRHPVYIQRSSVCS